MYHKKATGDLGERLVVRYLERKGYRVVETNYHTRYGEIDIIARRNHVWVFIEVKTRTSTAFGRPEESVTRRKRERWRKSAWVYREEKRLSNAIIQFDVVSVLLDDRHRTATVDHFHNIDIYA